MVTAFFNISGGEIFIVLLVVFIIFGPDKIPEIARWLGKGMNEIKKATSDIREEINRETEDIRDAAGKLKQDFDRETGELRNIGKIQEKRKAEKKRVDEADQEEAKKAANPYGLKDTKAKPEQPKNTVQDKPAGRKQQKPGNQEKIQDADSQKNPE